MEENFLMEKHKERLFSANKKLLNMYQEADPKDPDYAEKLEAIAKLHGEIATDFKNAENYEVEQDRLIEEADANKKGRILMIVKIGATVLMGVGAEILRHGRFKRSTEKENVDGGYLTMTDRTIVQEGLKEEKDRPQKLFGFMNK